MRFVPLFLAAALCGCAGSGHGHIYIPDTTTGPHRLVLKVDEGERMWVKVDTEGADTVVDFRGREFLFRGLTGYRGSLSFEKADLEIGGAEVEIDAERIRVRQGDHAATLDHAALPPHARVIYARGSIWSE